MNQIYYGDNLPILKTLPDESVDLIYIDPPFNTGKVQKRTTIRTIRSEKGDRKGFQGNHYQTIELGTKQFHDSFDSYIDGFLKPRLREAYRLLQPHGSIYFHIDYREVHNCKRLLDEIFGEDCFMNEIIWAYDYGGRSKSKWPAKHDNILFYVKDPTMYTFNADLIEKEPYMAPGLVGPEKAELGKLPTDTWWPGFVGPSDTWWQTIVPTTSKEKLGYPTQKPRRLIDRIITASSNIGSLVLDFFAGSGTVGESCLELNRRFILIDNNPAALEVMAKRFTGNKNIQWKYFDPEPYQSTEKKPETNGVERLDNNFVMLAASANALRGALQSDLEEQMEFWKNSPFEWIIHLSAAKKGKLARELITRWCGRNKIIIERDKSQNSYLIINGKKAAIKMSTRWTDGKYKFQQIRDGQYDYVVCLGISPFEAHCWVFEKKYAIKNATPQHRGATGAEYWIAIDPNSQDDWTMGFGGSLDQATQVLKNIGR
jgi:site-specific DNA-methyltransferase (adenine-specific)